MVNNYFICLLCRRKRHKSLLTQGSSNLATDLSGARKPNFAYKHICNYCVKLVVRVMLPELDTKIAELTLKNKEIRDTFRYWVERMEAIEHALNMKVKKRSGLPKEALK